MKYPVFVRRLLTALSLLLPVQSCFAANFIDYYKMIALAETAVVNQKYQDAIQLYNDAFSKYPYNNPVDCYVAAQVASYVGDTAHCISFIRKGILYGLPLKTAMENPHLSPFLQNKLDGPFKAPVTDSLQEVYQQSINAEARAKAISLIQHDQSIVRNLNGRSLYQGYGKILKPMYQPVWDSLLNEVIRLTTTYGFPAQKIIGTQNGDDSLFVISPHNAFVYYIFIHHGNAWPRVGTMLLAELEKGNITPQMYGAIADYSNGSKDYPNMRYFSLRACSTPYCKKTVRSKLQAINMARHEIGLCSYEVMEKKELSTQAYRIWHITMPIVSKPVFDFQQELHFMGTNR